MNRRLLSILFLGIISIITPTSGFSADYKEIAPGVFFLPSASGCNTGWVIFNDYVLAIDSGFPASAEELVKAIKQTTDKPIRFVFTTHDHGDHVFGNSILAREGAAEIAAREILDNPRSMKQAYEDWVKDKPDFTNLTMIEPSIFFDDRLVLEDDTQRVELLTYGHGHGYGDAIAYLPKQKILFTGDLCVNGAFNYLGDSHLEHWIGVLEMLQGLTVESVCPGHGAIAGKDLLQTQADYLRQLRDRVRENIDAGKTEEEIVKEIKIPLYEKWTGVPVPEHNLRHAYRQLTGLSASWELRELGLKEGPSPTRDSAGWTPPKKMIVRNLNEKELSELTHVAPDMEFVNVSSDDEMLKQIADADAVMGPLTPELLQAAQKLRWAISISAGVETYLFSEFQNSDVVLTNGQGNYAPAIADHVLGFILMFSKGQTGQYENKLRGEWNRSSRSPLIDLEGKTLLILGLGGIGGQIAKRAAGFDMTILAVDPKSLEKPQYVQAIASPDRLLEVLPKADFVVSTVPLTPRTTRYFNKQCFETMKPTAYFVNVGRGETVNQSDLIEALQNKTIAGAALDVFDPEPLPSDSPLWKMENVILTPHVSGFSDGSQQRAWLLVRENVRRFANGLPLLNVVNKKAGY